MNVVGFVFARGGSKGVPRKNLRLLAGKPLIAYSIEAALASRSVQRVVISTEDEEIAEVARRFGGETPFLRPCELATDSAPEWLAWQHAIRSVEGGAGAEKIDVFVSIPPTAPLRSPGDIDACVDLLTASGADVVVTVAEAHRNPYFNMVVLDESQKARIVATDGRKPCRRQDAPRVYDMTTVAYAARPDYVLSVDGLFNGDVRAVVVPPERAIDIDTELDMAFAEFLLDRNRLAGPLGK